MLMSGEHSPRFLSLDRLLHPLLMGVCASLMGLEALAPHLPVVIAVLTLFSGTFVTYFLATLTPSIDFNPPTRFSYKEAWWLLLISPVALTILFLPEALIIQYLGAGLIGFLYYIRVKTGQFIFNGLRSFFLLKNIALSLAWSLATVSVDIMQGETINFFLYRFYFIMALSIAIDCRDMEDDKKNGIPTIPLRTSFGFSCLLACMLMVAGYLTLISERHQSLDGHDLTVIAGITTAAAACSLVLIYVNRKKQFIRWVVDGNLLLHGIAFLTLHLNNGTN